MRGTATVPGVSQLSFFSADVTEPQIWDLGGLLAAHGQIANAAGGARLSVVLAERWRADALLAECRVREVPADVVVGEAADGAFVLRTERSAALTALAKAWTRGAVKAVPADEKAAEGLLRCWTLAAGGMDEAGFRLGLDPHAPDTHPVLCAMLADAGLAGAFIGVRGGGPAVRIVGHRRMNRLAALLGTPPDGMPTGIFP